LQQKNTIKEKKGVKKRNAQCFAFFTDVMNARQNSKKLVCDNLPKATRGEEKEWGNTAYTQQQPSHTKTRPTTSCLTFDIQMICSVDFDHLPHLHISTLP
jgi:hypothetical protein